MNDKQKALLNDFLKEKKYYKCGVKRFIRYLENKRIELKDVRHKEVQRLYKWLKKQNYAAITIKGTIEIARSFYKYLKNKGFVNDNPFGDRTRHDASLNNFTSTQKKMWFGFYEYEKQRGIKEVRKEVSYFAPFFQYLEDKTINYLEFNKKDVTAFEVFLTNLKNTDGSNHYQEITIMKIMFMIKRFYNYLKGTGKINTNPFIKKIRKNELKKQKQKRIELSISKEKQEFLEEFLKERVIQGYRDKKGMRNRVKKLLSYLQEYGFDFSDIKVKQAQDYQAWLIEDRTNNGKKYLSGSIQNFNKGAVRFYDFFMWFSSILCG